MEIVYLDNGDGDWIPGVTFVDLISHLVIVNLQVLSRREYRNFCIYSSLSGYVT